MPLFESFYAVIAAFNIYGTRGGAGRKAFCGCPQAWAGGYRLEKVGFALSIWAVEKLADDQELKSTSRHARCRWNFLIQTYRNPICSALLI